MGARVTGDEVKEIMDTDLTATQLLPFITSANAIVTDRVSGQGPGTDLLKEIEKWLAAHLAKIREPQLSSERIGEAQNNYVTQVGLGLDATTYGQQVKILDSTGILSSIGKMPGKIEVLLS